MRKITTDAWVLYRNESETPQPAELQREPYTFELTDDDVLVEPIYGCWEANMTHALERDPIDICRQRGEEKIVIGNSGVVRVLEDSATHPHLKAGQLCMIYGDPFNDKYGYTLQVLGYDAPYTMGLFAKQSKVPPQCLIPFPEESTFTAKEWAAFCVRYVTAWENWRVSYGCWRVQMPNVDPADIHVWAWGGGVGLAQLALARAEGFQTAMVASSDQRLALIESMGIRPIDRREFAGLSYEPEKYQQDPDYRARYVAAERRFLEIVNDHTGGEGVSIFVDNIGLPVFRATTKALARQGVITTSGWKHGMKLTVLRAIECINRHLHVHTHGSHNDEVGKAMAASAGLEWRPPVADDPVYGWDEIPQLAEDYAAGRIESYFPLYAINPL